MSGRMSVSGTPRSSGIAGARSIGPTTPTQLHDPDSGPSKYLKPPNLQEPRRRQIKLVTLTRSGAAPDVPGPIGRTPLTPQLLKADLCGIEYIWNTRTA